MAYLFPFGQELHPLIQQDQQKKKVFILGVYASAVHAKWKKGTKTIAQALAVASEPYIFWDGNPEEACRIIKGINIPAECGTLEPADSHLNGPSAKVLDEDVLAPLGFSRKDAWLCDMLPETRLNPNQLKVIRERYEPIMVQYGLNSVTVPPCPSTFCDELRSKQITAELIKSEAELLVLLGDLPIRQYLHRVAKTSYSSLQKYVEQFGYGNSSDITIGNKTIKVLPLVHPRQIGALGPHSESWCQMHREWELHKK